MRRLFSIFFFFSSAIHPTAEPKGVCGQRGWLPFSSFSWIRHCYRTYIRVGESSDKLSYYSSCFFRYHLLEKSQTCLTLETWIFAIPSLLLVCFLLTGFINPSIYDLSTTGDPEADKAKQLRAQQELDRLQRNKERRLHRERQRQTQQLNGSK